LEANRISEIIKANLEIITVSLLAITLIIIWIYLSRVFKTEAMKNQREAVELSIYYIDRFNSTVLPHYQNYKVNVSNLAYDNFDHISDYTGIHDFQKEYPLTILQVLERKKMNVEKSLHDLDIIATAILHGQLDQEIFIKLCGREFCEAVEVYYDMILHIRRENPEAFGQIITIYKDWRKRFAEVKTPKKKM